MISIKPYQKNAKKHPQKQLELIASSIRDFGWQQPIKVGEDMVIIVGHGRWFAYEQYKEKFNLKEPWVVDKDGKTISGGPETRQLTEIEERDYRLRDNKIAESGWEMDLVIPELKDLDSFGVDIRLTGFSMDLIVEPSKDDDDVPEIPIEPKSKLGDLYELGVHRILCGDSTKKEDVENLMSGHKADMVFTDPPYNVNYKGQGEKTSNTILNDKMSNESFDLFLAEVFKRYDEISKDGAGWYVFHSSSTQHQFQKAIENAGWTIKSQIIWNKPMSALGWGDYRWKHEPMFYCGKEKTVFYGDRTHSTVLDIPEDDEKALKWIRKQKELEGRGLTTIWSMKRENVNEYIHPTQKPVELISYAIKNSSKEGDIVVDLFGGSGSVMVACEKFNRGGVFDGTRP